MKKIYILFFISSITSSFASNYRLNTNNEILINGITISTMAYSHFAIDIDTSKQNHILNKDDIFVIDRYLMSSFNPIYDNISDALLAINVAAPVLTNYHQFTYDWTLPIMYGETILVSSALSYLVKKIVQRARPYLYYVETPIEQVNKYDARLSFFSGHSSLSFSSSVFNSIIFEKYNPNSEYRNLVWILSLSSAAATATLRILAGKHFFSDVLVGAIVGSLVSYCITEIHKPNIIENKVSNITLLGIRIVI